jgi:hypothetical protein
MCLTDIYRVFHHATAWYTFFSAVYGNFSKTDHIFGHKARLNKYKKIEITSWILSDHNGIKLELNNKRNSRKYSNTWRLNNTWLHDQWVIEKIREEIKNSCNSMDWKHKGKAYSHECIYQKHRKIPNKWPNAAS